MKKKIILSPLSHTWFIDIDGTILKHNGYLSEGHDTLLPGAKEFFSNIPSSDKIVLVSSRKEEYRATTLAFLSQCQIRFDEALFGVPMGERVLINDRKTSGLCTALAVSPNRDEGLSKITIKVDKKI